jgi:hypothetical protein
MDPENNSLTPATTSNETPITVPSSTAIAEPTDKLSAGAKAGIGASAAVVAIVLFSGMLLFYYRRWTRKNSLRTAKSHDNLSLQEISGPTNHEAQELDATEPPVELSASPPSIRDSTDSPTDILESAPASPTADLPEYPRQLALENQEPKSLNHVLENGGLEPKSLNTPQERPRRPP